MQPNIFDEVEKIIDPIIFSTSSLTDCPLKNKIILCFLRLKHDLLHNENCLELEEIIQKHKDSLNSNLSESDKTKGEIKKANQVFEEVKCFLKSKGLIPITWEKSIDITEQPRSSGKMAWSVFKSSVRNMMLGTTSSDSKELSERLLNPDSSSSSDSPIQEYPKRG